MCLHRKAWGGWELDVFRFIGDFIFAARWLLGEILKEC